MVNRTNFSFRRFFVALVVGALLGVAAGLALRAQREAAIGASLPEGALEDNPAWQYVQACQEGNWEQVVEMTLWMRDRLEFVQESGGPDAADAEKDRLMESLGTRIVADNRLREEGVEDSYVFTPGAEVTVVSADAGRDDLEAPVAQRTWFRVTYPAREKSLLDSGNVPIRSMRAGVNISTDGHVLKANIIGNLEIDQASIAYDWPSR